MATCKARQGKTVQAKLNDLILSRARRARGTRTQEQRPLTKHHGANGRVLAGEPQRRGRITGEAAPMWSEAGLERFLKGPARLGAWLKVR